jgi:hypothetical protein
MFRWAMIEEPRVLSGWTWLAIGYAFGAAGVRLHRVRLADPMPKV